MISETQVAIVLGLLQLLHPPPTPPPLPMDVLGHVPGFYVVIQDKGFPQPLFCDAGEPFSRTGGQVHAFITPFLHDDAVTSLFLSSSMFHFWFPSGSHLSREELGP